MRRFIICVAAAATLGSACSNPEKAAADSARMAASEAAATMATLVGEVGGMKVPESVLYDAELDQFYVSNIDGDESAKDGKAFIAIVRPDSLTTMTMLVEGGKNGATLNAPKGMALAGDTLWVSDIDAVRGFNRRTGKPVATVDLRSLKATFLNDVAMGPNGAIYVTDTGIDIDSTGAVTHPGANQIIRISGRTATVVATGDALASPNGIAWDHDGGHWILGPFGSPDVQTWNEGDAAPARLASGPGQYDGVEVIGSGRILVSSWADSAVYLVRDGAMKKVIANVSAPADIGFDSRRSVIAVPRFNDRKVEFYRLP